MSSFMHVSISARCSPETRASNSLPLNLGTTSLIVFLIFKRAPPTAAVAPSGCLTRSCFPALFIAPSQVPDPTKASFNRSTQFWLIQEALKRNPDIPLMALHWGMPYWVGDGNTLSEGAVQCVKQWPIFSVTPSEACGSEKGLGGQMWPYTTKTTTARTAYQGTT